MKTITLTIALVLTSALAFSQDIIKLKATGMSAKEKLPSGKWGEWVAKDNKEGIIIVIYIKEQRIKVFGSKTLVYEVLAAGKEKKDSDGDTYFDMECLDYDGDECDIRYMILDGSSVPGSRQIYIYYPNFAIVWNTVKLND
jgi:hypothetical protein